MSDCDPNGHEAHVALVDLLDRLLDNGVVIAGDLTLTLADVDLVYISVRALICSAAKALDEEHDCLSAPV